MTWAACWQDLPLWSGTCPVSSSRRSSIFRLPPSSWSNTRNTKIVEQVLSEKLGSLGSLSPDRAVAWPMVGTGSAAVQLAKTELRDALDATR